MRRNGFPKYGSGAGRCAGARPPPGGESYADVAARVSEWLSDLTEDQPRVVVCHGAASRVVRGLYAGLPRDEMLALPEPQDQAWLPAGGRISDLTA